MSGSTNKHRAPQTTWQQESDTRGVFALILRGDRLLISEYRDRETWNLAGGGVRIGETDIDALRREVRDETGLEVHVYGRVGGERRQHTDRIQLYFCTQSGGTLLATEESLFHRWVTADDIGDLPFPGGHDGRMKRMVYDGLSLLAEPMLVTRIGKRLTGDIEVSRDSLWLQISRTAALRWERLPLSGPRS
jgi:8-oxo-dGTP pyrophosphatase MutT (NUDIX family)